MSNAPRIKADQLHHVAHNFSIEWQDCINQRDYGYVLKKLLAPSMRFFSPAVHQPYAERAVIDRLLGFVLVVFEDFRYFDEAAISVDEYLQQATAVLRFTAKVKRPSDGKVFELEGVDIFTVNAEGQAIELRVMVRPLAAMLAVAEAMKAKLESDTANISNAFAKYLQPVATSKL